MSLSYDQWIILRFEGMISLYKIGEFCNRYRKTPGHKLIKGTSIETLSFNRMTGKLEWKPVTAVHVNRIETDLKTTVLSDGRSVTTTSNHSLFTLDDQCNFIEIAPSHNPKTVITVRKVDPPSTIWIDPDLAFVIGVAIGDGNLADNNGDPDSSVRFCVSNLAVADRTSKFFNRINGSNPHWNFNGKKRIAAFTTVGIPFIRDIGHRAPHKQIPEPLLSAPDGVLYELLDGLLSTDGNVSRGRYEYSTTSETLIHQIEFILRRLGLNYHIDRRWSESNFKRNFPIWRICLTAASSQFVNVTNTSRKIPKDVKIDQTNHDFSVIRKMIKELCPGLSTCGYAWKTNSRKLKYSDLMRAKHLGLKIWNKIKEILPSEVREIRLFENCEFVYDIGVMDNENFVLANGIVVHNSLIKLD